MGYVGFHISGTPEYANILKVRNGSIVVDDERYCYFGRATAEGGSNSIYSDSFHVKNTVTISGYNYNRVKIYPGSSTGSTNAAFAIGFGTNWSASGATSGRYVDNPSIATFAYDGTYFYIALIRASDITIHDYITDLHMDDLEATQLYYFSLGDNMQYHLYQINNIEQQGGDYPIHKMLLDNYSNDLPSSDPYGGAGDSSTGGGGGTFDPSGDDIPFPSLPMLSASDAGFITLFNPSVSQLNSLATYMWTNSAFDIANFKKIFEDPMDCILGLSIVPLAVTTSGSADVAIGNLVIPSIQFPVVSSQYQEFNCGTVTIPEFFGGYLDYEPYTKIQIAVPYCGTFQISADDVIGKTLELVYHIDVLTGSCVAMLKCGTTVLYQFNGSCAVNIPINSINYASTIENATRIAVAIGTTVATAGAAAPAMMAGGEAAGTAGATLFNSALNTAGATAEGALSMKPSIERSGALSSSSGMMSVQTPYIIITRPRLCKPKDQDRLKGYPSFIETTAGALTGKGYTEFDTIILNNIYLTDSEKGELDKILRGGVFL